jgi:hypothetical protein
MQQWLHERASMLRYTYTAPLGLFVDFNVPVLKATFARGLR